MKIVSFLKKMEGFSAQAYPDGNGCSIGYGHKIKSGEKLQVLSEAEAEAILVTDILIIQAGLRRLIRVPLRENQEIALISFTFNVGLGALQRSILRAKINRAEHEDVPLEMGRWVYSGGKVMKGLVRRRQLEGELYYPTL